MIWILDPAPGAKYSEVTDVWLLASKELIGCLVQNLVKINTVDDMASSINGFRPEFPWSPVLIKHCTCHLNEFSAPYTPQQNGIVERKNRTLIEMAQMMLDEYKTPRKFWLED